MNESSYVSVLEMTVVTQLFEGGKEEVASSSSSSPSPSSSAAAEPSALERVKSSEAYKKAASALESAKAWTWWSVKKAGGWGWIITTTALVVGLPVSFAVEQEAQLKAMEAQQIQQLRAQGYSTQDIAAMQANGMLGAPPQPQAAPQ